MSQSSLGTRERLRALHDKFIVEDRWRTAGERTRLYLLSAALIVIGVAGFMIILADIVQRDDVAGIDIPMNAWLMQTRTGAMTTIMIGLAIGFGPVALPVIIFGTIVVWGVLAKHLWRPVLLALGTLTGLVLVQVITRLVERHRPPVELMLFGVDTTYSFPSGHVSGATNFLLLLTYLIYSRRAASRRAVIVVGVLLVIAVGLAALSRVYLGYHWPTDALASIALALAILGGIIALDTWRTVRVRADGRLGADASVSADR
ncbi:phosphatase PAP2 family protein [Cryobacterium sp. PAMC25264]|uniref:phosphatase PAP2 family protein n=1 Tax=Cryobacterium sp. PAMC25264 TaxID=2861288 RepID=UPI001C62CC70|nr:phosphatase PAP2 family protein [Cryobacterium sp. PAMC25264]QYF72281.1 phosphatase PAP2 family protein [Cryobacterium sp. PAMC25264]